MLHSCVLPRGGATARQADDRAYAEAVMDVRPWRDWTPDGRPIEGVAAILAVAPRILAGGIAAVRGQFDRRTVNVGSP
jgi:hypothetical protein